jgi:chromosome partitioning protein
MKLQRTHIVAFANQKGGCGKTTSAVSIAAALAVDGYTVCLVDTDQQCNATTTFGIDSEELKEQGRPTVAEAYLSKTPAAKIQIPLTERFEGRLSIVPSHRALHGVGEMLEAEIRATIAQQGLSDLDSDDMKNEHRGRLKNSLASLRGKVDFVIIDTPPELRFLTTSVLIASDWFVIPIFPSRFDLDGLQRLLSNTQKVQKHFNPGLRLAGVILANVNMRTKLDKDLRERLSDQFGADVLFGTPVTNSVVHRQATMNYQTIFEFAPDEQASQQYMAIARELVSRLVEATAALALTKEAANA